MHGLGGGGFGLCEMAMGVANVGARPVCERMRFLRGGRQLCWRVFDSMESCMAMCNPGGTFQDAFKCATSTLGHETTDLTFPPSVWLFTRIGCMHPGALNYDASALVDDGSCHPFPTTPIVQATWTATTRWGERHPDPCQFGAVCD